MKGNRFHTNPVRQVHQTSGCRVMLPLMSWYRDCLPQKVKGSRKGPVGRKLLALERQGAL